jgi:hypothetical protein
MIKKIFKILAIISIISFFLLHTISIPISREYDAIEIKLDDPSYIENCKVSINGKYYFNFLIADAFEGDIKVSSYPVTNKKIDRVEIVKDYTLWYYSLENKNKVWHPFAILSSDVLFKNMVLLVKSNPMYNNHEIRPAGTSASWNEIDGYCIVPSVNTREDAINKLYELDWLH